jgi:branched-chain amino acid transport system substrate-binding protein
MQNLKITLLAGAALFAASLASAQAEKVRLGVLTDMTGFAADSTGPGSVVATKFAIEDFHKESPATQVELLQSDHQNKPDIGSAIARRWIAQDGVTAILDVPVSSVALGVQEVVRGSKTAFIASGPGTAELTGTKCSPNTVHWT